MLVVRAMTVEERAQLPSHGSVSSLGGTSALRTAVTGIGLDPASTEVIELVASTIAALPVHRRGLRRKPGKGAGSDQHVTAAIVVFHAILEGVDGPEGAVSLDDLLQGASLSTRPLLLREVHRVVLETDAVARLVAQWWSARG
ncbi:hypothetical protein SAMN02800687_0433 [Curtobacterium sp. UNCCL20]|uniref:hypothetical protein n=1 Tax=Curtobacterium sp. UNCCL20 TaxID=1502773 RepID=UPI00088D5DCB|nr:hypothetical protein [Curtobacterium sp. UNCCL20]SDQ12365.1 hypothetical protein SAMN02800687_0433 [Curtobacterium sp. UNCCL20]